MNALPKHVAIIMDGNGRWAQRQGLTRIKGHYAGAKVAQRMVECALDSGVSTLTLFAFGIDNLTRPALEVSALFALIESKLKALLSDLVAQGVRFQMIGDRSILPVSVRSIVESAEKQTAKGARLTLNVAINYSGHWHICDAIKRTQSPLCETSLKATLEGDFSCPDLLIRTSGEKRLSNFMLWHLAYTELCFVDTMWPDFSPNDWQAALDEFASRERRYGGVEATHV